MWKESRIQVLAGGKCGSVMWELWGLLLEMQVLVVVLPVVLPVFLELLLLMKIFWLLWEVLVS